ncbi:5146_t:CDS:2 [Acaulospora morrowiae]|uniref:5146_t:CDS:1 n=1 Tax=Acaulospora morrowiae TaxID=94023 RepID=A0A9N8YQ76_9GLOM|nr:5146_t:CDS:2 [Acaulospora morrowiae]
MTQESKKSLGTLSDYVLLGCSGLRVLPLCLGTMTFGENWGFGANFEECKEVFDHYFEQGDTANLYTGGDPASAELGIGTVPWGFLAEGRVKDSWEKNWEILDEVKKISKEVNRSPVQVALNWIAQKPGITSSLIGARTKAQLVENIKALEFKLTPEQINRLDNVSEPPMSFPQSFYGFGPGKV